MHRSHHSREEDRAVWEIILVSLYIYTLKGEGGRGEEGLTLCCSQECLKRRYDEDLATIIAAGRPKELNKLLGHVHTEAYVWRCPVCCKNCNCAPHRKQYGLPPVGFIASLAKEKGLTVSQLLQDPSAMEAAKMARDAAATPKKMKLPASEGAVVVVEGKEKKLKKLVVVMEKGKDKPKERIAKKAVPGEAKKEKVPMSSADKKEKSMEKALVKAKEKAAAKAAKAVAKAAAKAATKAAAKDIMPVVASTITLAPIKPFIRQPKHVEDPDFEFIGISYPLEVIEKRLYVRCPIPPPAFRGNPPPPPPLT